MVNLSRAIRTILPISIVAGGLALIAAIFYSADYLCSAKKVTPSLDVVQVKDDYTREKLRLEGIIKRLEQSSGIKDTNSIDYKDYVAAMEQYNSLGDSFYFQTKR